MKLRRARRLCRQFFPLLACLTVIPAFAVTTSWTNVSGGLWRISTNWLNNVLPASGNPTLLTNTGNKTITIDPTTPSTNLTVSTLLVRAPAGFTNSLQLLDLTTNRPLVIGTAYTNGAGGALLVSNSAINATSATRFFIDAGAVAVENGMIDCTTTPMRVGRTGNGSLSVKSGSLFADEIIVGDAALSQGNLTLTGGLANITLVLTVGGQANSTGTVSVANAQLSVSDPTVTNKIGSSGFGQMTIEAAGTVTLPSLSVGDGLTGKGTVTVNGGQINVTDTIVRFGNAGFGQLTLNGGGVNIDTPIILGDNAGATGIVSVVSGQFIGTDTNETDIGHFGTGQLNISGGKTTLLSTLILADSPGSVGRVNLTGGELLVTNGITSVGRFGIGTMTISNATAMLTNVSVGRHEGATGTLTLRDGGNLFQHDDLSIGRFTNAVGNVLVDGGLLSLANDTIWVGREGLGHLTVSNGIVEARNLWVALSTVTTNPTNGQPVTNMPSGTFTLAGGVTLVSSNFVLGTPLLSTGQVSVIGGTLVVTNSANKAQVSVGSGTLALNGGKIIADHFFVTNAAGRVTFDSGMLQTKRLVVSNGLPFVVGDGVQAATLQLLGGVYSFADGLVISSNASVIGCGTILGSITNRGTLATNCGPVITITAIAKTGNVATVSFETMNGSTHLLEYKDKLTDALWSAISPGVTGTGGVMSATDTNATAPSRFYRVHVQ